MQEGVLTVSIQITELELVGNIKPFYVHFLSDAFRSCYVRVIWSVPRMSVVRMSNIRLSFMCYYFVSSRC